MNEQLNMNNAVCSSSLFFLSSGFLINLGINKTLPAKQKIMLAKKKPKEIVIIYVSPVDV
jgi:hypothetical protein